MLSDKKLTEVFAKTKGHCHFCGDRLTLAKYAEPEASRGAWEIDHVVQKAKGGLKDISNCLPACVKCNRLRWHRSGKDVRDLILFGLTPFFFMDLIRTFLVQIGMLIPEEREVLH
jgi:5-methylcytosine-specific restriction endonuclease McrA